MGCRKTGRSRVVVGRGQHVFCKLCKKAVPETPVKRLHYEVFKPQTGLRGSCDLELKAGVNVPLS
jgi:hypothetical protein